MVGIRMLALERDPVLPFMCTSMFSRKMVPPPPSMLTAMPARMMSVFSFRLKKPIIRPSRMPTSTAISTPRTQLWVQ